jgi:hypothetical protein
MVPACRSVSNRGSKWDQERCVVRQGLGGPRWVGNSAAPGDGSGLDDLSAGCQQRFLAHLASHHSASSRILVEHD